jgi:hypothetical protein
LSNILGAPEVPGVTDIFEGLQGPTATNALQPLGLGALGAPLLPPTAPATEGTGR